VLPLFYMILLCEINDLLFDENRRAKYFHQSLSNESQPLPLLIKYMRKVRNSSVLIYTHLIKNL
jgi:hypothetical protein